MIIAAGVFILWCCKLTLMMMMMMIQNLLIYVSHSDFGVGVWG